MRIEYADRMHNQTEPEELTWARTLDEARQKAAEYEKRAVILRFANMIDEAEKMKKKACDLRAEVRKAEIRGQIPSPAEVHAADTRRLQKRMLQIEME